jgi:RNA polymerase sigma-70 factor (ECF subfamily)
MQDSQLIVMSSSWSRGRVPVGAVGSGFVQPRTPGDHWVVASDDDLRDLLEKAAEGDDRALGVLVRRTQRDVWRLCTALGSVGEVDDLVQETYLRAIPSIPRYRGESSVRSWLLAIARNVCADHVRRRQRERRLVERIRERTVEPVSPEPELPMTSLEHLSEERREAFVLTQLLDLSYEDAAAVVGCPVGTIRSRVFRARQDLAATVERRAAN